MVMMMMMMKMKKKTGGGSQGNSLSAALLLVCCLMIRCQSEAQAQDILRQQRHHPKQQPQQQNLNSNPLANIQLPPQLASLTPQQLHQLAQLRELQLQQQAAQQQQQQQDQAMAPAPIGAEPTASPQDTASGQIPQPGGSAAAAASGESNDRHDDGSYNESGTEMEGVTMSGDEVAASGVASTATSSSGSGGSSQQPSAPAAAAPTFEVNWNKCPQLEPSETEKNKKTQVITKCLQAAPIPNNLTRENVEAHREQIATCALRDEGWFDEQGSYRYEKAEGEIRAKRLEATIENQVLKFHVACKEEAAKKFPRDQNRLIDQVQFYQACMDYYISIVCEIEVSVDQ